MRLMILKMRKAALRNSNSSILLVKIYKVSVKQIRALLIYFPASLQLTAIVFYPPALGSLQLINSYGSIRWRQSKVSNRLIRAFVYYETIGWVGKVMQWFSMREINLGMEFYSQGHLPQSISQRITPNDQISARKSYDQPLRTYGAIQIGDPTIVCVISFSFKSYLQKPKSASLSTPYLNKIFEGLRSRCRMLVLKRVIKAFLIWSNSSSASSSVIAPFFLMRSVNVPPSQYSQTKKKLLFVFRTSINFMMLGWSRLLSIEIQLLVNSVSLGCSLNLSMLITFTAKQPDCVLCSALQTLPYCPEPTFSCKMQSSIS